MIKIDMSARAGGEKPEVRGALGVEANLKPVIFFFDRDGNLLSNATLKGWAGKGASEPKKAAGKAIHKRLALILGEETTKSK